MLKAGLIGFGGISKSHRWALEKLEGKGRAKLVCAYDIDPKAFEGSKTINIDSAKADFKEKINYYTDFEEMLKNEEVDFFCVCVPSFLHKEITVKLLGLGYHVLCEKPMALNYEDCEKMINAAEENGRELMIGQCLRFYPAFDYIKEAILENRFGKILGGFFSRLSTPPVWGWENWFMNPERSGGCMTDLHIHDVDVIRYLFGEPEAVSCHASTSVCKYDTVHTSFLYGDTPVTAVGDWTLVGMPFEAKCRIDFEKATVVYGSDLTVYPKDGTPSYKVELAKISGHEGEIAYFADVIEGRTANTKNPASSAATTIRLIEHMRESAEKHGETVVFNP